MKKRDKKISKVNKITRLSNEISPKEMIYIDYHKLEKSISFLSKYHDDEINKLENNSRLNKKFQIVRLTVLFLLKKGNYDKIKEIISKQYRPSVIIPGTIGAFLFGCFQQIYGEIGATCSPLCIGSIYANKDQQHLCKNQIWLQKYDGNNRFGKIKSTTNSGKAYIFVNDDFNGFSIAEYKAFKKAKIIKAKIMMTKNGKHYSYGNFKNIDNLPSLDKITHETSFNEDENIDDKIYKYELFHIIFGFIIFLIILIIIYLFLQ